MVKAGVCKTSITGSNPVVASIQSQKKDPAWVWLIFLKSDKIASIKSRGGGIGRRNGLKIRRSNPCGFESHPRHQSQNQAISDKASQLLPGSGKQLVSSFLKSRREGLSPKSIKFYEGYLSRSIPVIGLHVNGQNIAQFLDKLTCTNGGKHAYFRVLRAIYNWLYSPKSGNDLAAQDNPILAVEAPKVGKRILPSLTLEQLDLLVDQAECNRDKAIISLFADSGLRLSELASVKRSNIDWQHKLIKVICKGNKEGYAPSCS